MKTTVLPKLFTDTWGPDAGSVYLAWSPRLRMYKIGHTTQVDRRLAELRRTADDPKLFLEYVADVLYASQTERILHQRYAERHRTGEWFALSAADVIAIRHAYPGGRRVD